LARPFPLPQVCLFPPPPPPLVSASPFSTRALNLLPPPQGPLEIGRVPWVTEQVPTAFAPPNLSEKRSKPSHHFRSTLNLPYKRSSLTSWPTHPIFVSHAVPSPSSCEELGPARYKVNICLSLLMREPNLFSSPPPTVRYQTFSLILPLKVGPQALLAPRQRFIQFPRFRLLVPQDMPLSPQCPPKPGPCPPVPAASPADQVDLARYELSKSPFVFLTPRLLLHRLSQPKFRETIAVTQALLKICFFPPSFFLTQSSLPPLPQVVPLLVSSLCQIPKPATRLDELVPQLDDQATQLPNCMLPCFFSVKIRRCAFYQAELP